MHLYELVQPEGGPLFFTMELVQGMDLIAYVNHAPRARGSESSSSTAHSQAALLTRRGPVRPGVISIAPPLSLGDEPTRADAERLRRSLRQVVLGLGALHGAGKLHRDVKPSNVLVTPEGRVVILDFGIALELSRAIDEAAREGGVVGTPRYLSPEQAVGDVPTPASDWYAVGVMMYEALAGRPPFEGSSSEVLSRKAMAEARAHRSAREAQAGGALHRRRAVGRHRQRRAPLRDHAPAAGVARFLLLMTLRDEEARTSPFLIEMNDRWPVAADVREVTVGALEIDDAQRLALACIGETDEASRRTARAVAREAKGSPFLIEELVRSNRETAMGDAGATLAVLTLAEIVGNRLAGLPAATRCLAEVVAVSGRPLPLSTLANACAEGAVTDEDVERLRSARVVRAGLRDGREVIEPCHDRIRETIVENLALEVLRALHGALARALEATSEADLEAVAIHALGSGDTERGASYAERAAEQAASKLAFDQAARLYRLALDTLPRPPDEARALRGRIAGALGLAGQGARAAKVYLEAAADAPPLEAIDLQRAASQQLLFSGRIDEGAALLRKVLAAARFELADVQWMTTEDETVDPHFRSGSRLPRLGKHATLSHNDLHEKDVGRGSQSALLGARRRRAAREEDRHLAAWRAGRCGRSGYCGRVRADAEGGDS